MVVRASYNTAYRYLFILAGGDDDVVNVSREPDGTILINNGDVTISGGTPTASNTDFIYAVGFDGNDQITLDEHNGALPRAYLFGGGNDLLIGGSGRDYLSGGADNDLLRGGDNADSLYGGTGNDVLLGDHGNDSVYGGDGSDLLIVNNGDGSDLLEGGEGFDVVQVNGANAAGDEIHIDPNGERVRVTGSNADGGYTLNIGTTKNLDINGGAGADTFINGETIVDSARVASGDVSLADLESGRARVVRDARSDGVDTIANYEVGVDKIVVTGFDFARDRADQVDLKGAAIDDVLHLSIDDDRAILSFDTDGAGKSGFVEQWVI